MPLAALRKHCYSVSLCTCPAALLVPSTDGKKLFSEFLDFQFSYCDLELVRSFSTEGEASALSFHGRNMDSGRRAQRQAVELDWRAHVLQSLCDHFAN